MDTNSVMARLQAEPNRQAIAAATGMSYMHLYKLQKGWVKHPRAETIDKLRAYFQSKDAK